MTRLRGSMEYRNRSLAIHRKSIMTHTHSLRIALVVGASALRLGTSASVAQNAAEVTVSGLAQASGDQIVVQVVADAPKTALYSFGVGILYDPNELTPIDGAVDPNNWFFGEVSAKSSYPGFWLPQDDEKALLIGGRLDVANPTEGLAGSDLALGSVTFSILGSDTPKLALELARNEETFSNFVSVDGRVLDGAPGSLVFESVEFHDGPVDSDRDGLDDEWERDHFGDLSEGPDGDPDKDQFSTGDEFVAGTDPDDGNSFLQLHIDQDPLGAVLRWESAPGRVYSLESASVIPGRFSAVATGIPATPPENELDLSISEDAGQLYYRLSVRRAAE